MGSFVPSWVKNTVTISFVIFESLFFIPFEPECTSIFVLVCYFWSITTIKEFDISYAISPCLFIKLEILKYVGITEFGNGAKTISQRRNQCRFQNEKSYMLKGRFEFFKAQTQFNWEIKKIEKKLLSVYDFFSSEPSVRVVGKIRLRNSWKSLFWVSVKLRNSF